MFCRTSVLVSAIWLFVQLSQTNGQTDGPPQVGVPRNVSDRSSELGSNSCFSPNGAQELACAFQFFCHSECLLQEIDRIGCLLDIGNDTIKNQESTIESITGSLNDVQSATTDAEQGTVNVTSRHTQFSMSASDLAGRADNLKMNITGLVDDFNDENGRSVTCQNTARNSLSQITMAVNAFVAELCECSDEQIAGYDSELRSTSGSLTTIAGTLNNVDTTLTDMDANLISLEMSVPQAEDCATNFTADISPIEDCVDKIESDLVTLKTDTATAETSLNNDCCNQNEISNLFDSIEEDLDYLMMKNMTLNDEMDNSAAIAFYVFSKLSGIMSDTAEKTETVQAQIDALAECKYRIALSVQGLYNQTEGTPENKCIFMGGTFCSVNNKCYTGKFRAPNYAAANVTCANIGATLMADINNDTQANDIISMCFVGVVNGNYYVDGTPKPNFICPAIRIEDKELVPEANQVDCRGTNTIANFYCEIPCEPLGEN